MFESEFQELKKISEDEERQKFLESIGETEESLLEMAQVGILDDTILIKIYGGEGPIPHFHFYETQSKRNGCIKILEASYFPHGGKYLDSLKRDEVKELISWLNNPNEFYKKRNISMSNWESICTLWDQNNPQYQLENPKPEIPNYIKYL